MKLTSFTHTHTHWLPLGMCKDKPRLHSLIKPMAWRWAKGFSYLSPNSDHFQIFGDLTHSRSSWLSTRLEVCVPAGECVCPSLFWGGFLLTLTVCCLLGLLSSLPDPRLVAVGGQFRSRSRTGSHVWMNKWHNDESPMSRCCLLSQTWRWSAGNHPGCPAQMGLCSPRPGGKL